MCGVSLGCGWSEVQELTHLSSSIKFRMINFKNVVFGVRNDAHNSSVYDFKSRNWLWVFKATSHTRLRARERYTSSTLIGGKGGASPSSLHTAFEGPTKYVNARWM